MIIIIWGRKLCRSKLGWVAGYCPICRAVTKSRLTTVYERGHVFYVALGRGSLKFHELRCENCRTTSLADVDQFISVSKKKRSLSELVKLTNPEVFDQYATDLMSAEELSTLADDSRFELVHAPLEVLAPYVDQHYHHGHFDRTAYALLVAFPLAFIAFLFLSIWGTGPNEPSNFPEWTFYVFPLSLFIWFLVALALEPRRYVRNYVLPRLGTALAPLKPTDEELKQSLDLLKVQNFKLGTKVRVQQLRRTIDNARLAMHRSADGGSSDTLTRFSDTWDRSEFSRLAEQANRFRIIREPFSELSWQIERRHGSVHFDGTALAMLAGLAACYALFWLLAKWANWSMSAHVGAGVGLATCFFVVLAREPLRFLRRRLIPSLAKALAPLEPKDEELAQVMQFMKDAGYKIGSKSLIKQIKLAISKAQTQGTT